MKSKLIKLLSLGIISFGLVSCNPAGGSTGRIDCYKIYEGGHTYQYHFVEKPVYEYTNEKGESIYTNFYRNYTNTGMKVPSLPLLLFSNRFSTEYTTYNFSKYVGYVYEEYNYYLNLDSKTLDQEVKYRKYTGSVKETTFNNEEITFNHDKAMSGVSKGYYTEYDNNSYYIDGETIDGCVIYKELHNTKTERHVYKMYGDATDISYVPKWF